MKRSGITSFDRFCLVFSGTIDIFSLFCAYSVRVGSFTTPVIP